MLYLDNLGFEAIEANDRFVYLQSRGDRFLDINWPFHIFRTRFEAGNLVKMTDESNYFCRHLPPLNYLAIRIVDNERISQFSRLFVFDESTTFNIA